MTARQVGIVIGSGAQPAVMLEEVHGGYTIDFVVSRGNVTELASGRLVPVDLDYPADRPSMMRPGRSIQTVYFSILSAEVWKQHRRNPGTSYSKARVKELTNLVFKLARNEGWIIAGKPTPLLSGSALVPIGLVDFPYLDFDWFRDIARPVHGLPGATFADVRVFTTEEWAVFSGEPVTSASRIRSHPPSRSTGAAEKPTPAQSEAWAWMIANVTKPGAWKRDLAILACRKALSVPDRVAKWGWKKLPDDLRGARGQKKRSP